MATQSSYVKLSFIRIIYPHSGDTKRVKISCSFNLLGNTTHSNKVIWNQTNRLQFYLKTSPCIPNLWLFYENIVLHWFYFSSMFILAFLYSMYNECSVWCWPFLPKDNFFYWLIGVLSKHYHFHDNMMHIDYMPSTYQTVQIKVTYI